MLSSGFSYKNVFFPAITVGVLVSLMSFYTNDVLLPAGTVQFNKLWRRILLTIPSLELEANSVKKFKDTVIVTGDVTGNVIDNVIILDKTSDGERRIILASYAELKDSGKEGLSLDLDNAFIHSSKEIVREDYDYARSGYLQYWVSNEDIIQASMNVSPREMSSRDVRTAIGRKRIEVGVRANDRKGKLIAQAYLLENILREGHSGESWNRKAAVVANLEREKITLAEIYRDRSLTIHIIEYYKKFSLPFGAFFFVFLAVSLGLMARKSGQTVGFIFGNIIAVVYWVMIFIGQTMGLRLGTSPFWSMWLPNIISLSVGVVLAIIRVRK
jgi:lipopolysaccharide export system permease protein